MEMVLNFYFKNNVYATILHNNFVGLNNKCAGNMKYANVEICRVGFNGDNFVYVDLN